MHQNLSLFKVQYHYLALRRAALIFNRPVVRALSLQEKRYGRR